MHTTSRIHPGLQAPLCYPRAGGQALPLLHGVTMALKRCFWKGGNASARKGRSRRWPPGVSLLWEGSVKKPSQAAPGRGTGGGALLCSPLALQVTPAEALEADDALSTAPVGHPLLVAPPCSLEVYGGLCPLQGPTDTVGAPAGLGVRQAIRDGAV